MFFTADEYGLDARLCEGRRGTQSGPIGALNASREYRSLSEEWAAATSTG